MKTTRFIKQYLQNYENFYVQYLARNCLKCLCRLNFIRTNSMWHVQITRDLNNF